MRFIDIILMDHALVTIQAELTIMIFIFLTIAILVVVIAIKIHIIQEAIIY